MGYFWNSIIFIFCFSFLVISLEGFFGMGEEDMNSTVSTLDAEISKTMNQPNKWGYSFSLKPKVFGHGLTYVIDGVIEVKNLKFDSIDNAERFYVAVYTDFVTKLNSIRVLRPFLASFPLTPDSCMLVVRFIDSKGHSVCPPNIASIYMADDSLKFMKYVDLKDLAGSPYEVIGARSLHTVEGLIAPYAPRVQRHSLAARPKIPTFTCLSTSDGSPSMKAEFEFVQAFCKGHGLEIVILGCVGENYHDSRAFQFALRGSQCLVLDDARILGAKCSGDVLNFVQHDPRCLEYVQTRSTKPHEKYPSPTPIPEHLGFRISFWDENVDRQPAPYIAEIRFLDGKFRYFTADENQCLVLVYEETFDEAQSFLKSQKA